MTNYLLLSKHPQKNQLITNRKMSLPMLSFYFVYAAFDTQGGVVQLLYPCCKKKKKKRLNVKEQGGRLPGKKICWAFLHFAVL